MGRSVSGTPTDPGDGVSEGRTAGTTRPAGAERARETGAVPRPVASPDGPRADDHLKKPHTDRSPRRGLRTDGLFKKAAAGGAPKGLLVVGDVVTDVVARHRGALARGTDTAAEVRMLPGGAGANAACWAAYWGCADVRLLGCVGAESVDWHRQALRSAGVAARLVVDPEASTGTVICLVDVADGAERTFLTDSGASLRLSPTDFSPSLLDGIARLHLSGYLLFSDPGRALVRTAVAAARAREVPVSVDPASAGFIRELGAARFLALLDGVDVLLPSRDEAQLLTGLPDAGEAAARLSRAFPLVVAKQGAGGALVARNGSLPTQVSAVAVQPQDSTGAGDAFTGAFLASLLAGADPEEAAAEGCRAGAQAVARLGGRPPRRAPSPSELPEVPDRAG